MDNYNENNFNCNDINFAAPGTASQGEMTVGARNPDTVLCEPKKPVSAYALFFKDTVSAIKGQRPDVTYAEICTIVASMWEALDEPHKNVYHKKNELAKKEYVLQMSAYRLQQQQFHQQSEISNENQLSTTAASTTTTTTTTTTSPRQQLTKPAVFTIARPTHDNSTHITTSQPITTSQKNLISTSSPSFQYPQSMSTASMASGAAATTATTATVNSLCSTDTATNTIPHNYNMDPPQLNQMLNDSICSVQKCIRDSCPKRAIINPDWEDEYCSNECVVLHCRNVFNAWVQSNLETRAG